MPTIYLDVCCLNRPFDDQTQHRIRLEAEAILLVLARLQEEWTWVSSEAVAYEIRRNPNLERRALLELLIQAAQRFVQIDEAEEARAEELVAAGFHPLDALHVACAESGEADVLLTTDDQLLRVAHRGVVSLGVRVENPLRWIQEAGQ